jgi:hypothetical protein
MDPSGFYSRALHRTLQEDSMTTFGTVALGVALLASIFSIFVLARA